MEQVPRVTVGALVFNPDNELLLLRSHKWGNRYIVPCGHLEFMERLEDGVKREVLEETGLPVTDIRFIHYLEFLDSKDFHKSGLHFVGLQYICRTESREVVLNDEAQEHLWRTPQGALDLDLEPSTRTSIETYLSST